MRCTAVVAVIAMLLSLAAPVHAQDPAARRAAERSPLVQRAVRQLVREARAITDPAMRTTTLDALTNPRTCVAYRRNLTRAGQHAIVVALTTARLLAAADTTDVLGTLFPPLIDDGTACPRLVQPFAVAAGGNGSHHDYPGGLAVHEAYNMASALALAKVASDLYLAAPPTGGARLRLDIVRTATLWHDWAKCLIYLWRPDGTLPHETRVAGTWGHHIVGLAEAMARGLPADAILAQAAAHLAPGGDNDSTIAGWLRAAAIVARRDPVERGYLVRGADGAYRLPPARPTASQHGATFATIPEAIIVNIADDNLYSMRATADAEALLARVGPEYGYPARDTRYRNDFRNPVLSWLGADRIALDFREGGIAAVRGELDRLVQRGGFARRS